MTYEEMKYLLKRHSYISKALVRGGNTVFITSGGRKERIALDSTVKKFSDMVKKTLSKMDEVTRELMKQSVIEGYSDTYIYTNNNIPKSTYYHIKEDFQRSLFYLCICAGLVTEEEL